jgi:hypothetical protein
MKQLHNIYLRGLYKWLALAIVVNLSFILIFSFVFPVAKPLDTLLRWSYIIVQLSFLISLIFGFKQFSANIPIHINQNFNKLDLLRFYLFTQGLKLILLLGYLLYLALLFEGWAWLRAEINYLSMTHIFVFLILCFYMSASSPFTQSTSKKVGSNGSMASRLTLRPAQLYAFIFALPFAILLFNLSLFPLVYLYYYMALFFLMLLFDDINAVFQLSLKDNWILPVSLTFTTPLLLFVFLMRVDTKNPALEYSLRSSYVTELSILAPRFTEEEMTGFLQNVDDDKYTTLLPILHSNAGHGGIGLDVVLSSVTNIPRAHFILSHPKKFNFQGDYLKIINHVSKLISNKEFSYQLAKYSHKYFDDDFVNEELIDQLANSSCDFKKLMSLGFAQELFKDEQFNEFIAQRDHLFSEKLLIEAIEGRSIASESD